MMHELRENGRGHDDAQTDGEERQSIAHRTRDSRLQSVLQRIAWICVYVCVYVWMYVRAVIVGLLYIWTIR